MEGPDAPWALVPASHDVLLQSGTLRHARSALCSLEADLMAEKESLRLEQESLAGWR